MTIAEAEVFFAGYADAFSRSAVDEICALWAYPAFMSARGKRAALEAEAFRANTQALCRFYAARGLGRAHKDVLEVTPLTDTLDTVRTADTLFDAAGEVIAAWEHVYLVSATETGPKVIAAMPDGELDAWTARGTPLGSW